MRKKFGVLKSCCSVILIGVLMCCLTACNIAKKGIAEGQVVVLDNQQASIENVLSIKEIIEVKDFVGYQWIDDTQIIGMGISDGVRNIAIYNMNDQSISNLTNNQNDKERYFTFYHEIYSTFYKYQIPKDYILFKSGDGNNLYKEYSLLAYDIKNNKLVHIDDEIKDDQLIDGKQIYYAKEMKIYLYDMHNNTKAEIVLPEKLMGNLNYYFNTLEEYMAKHSPNEEEYSDFSIKISTQFFNEEKKQNRIERIKVKENKLQISSFNHESYIYDMKTKSFEKGFIKNEEYGDRINIGSVAFLETKGDTRNLCAIDKQGNLVDIIDTTWDFVEGFFLSPDESKLVYEIAYPMGEDRKYIYDFESKKKVTLLGNYLGAYWNSTSDKLICSESVYFDENISSKIVIFND